MTNDASTCQARIETMPTERLAAWAKQNADDASREARRWTFIRNTLWLGGVAVFGGTLYNFSNEVDREGEGDAATLLLGSALGITITYLGFSEAAPEVGYYRQRQARYRFLEREITQRAR
jgi:hypothetical protein